MSLGHKFYKLEREDLWQKQNHKCFYCGKKLKKHEATMDHVIPRSITKRHIKSNCVVSCYPCNSAKGKRSYYQPKHLDLVQNRALERIEERIKKSEYKLSLEHKGSFKKWKKYWQRRGRWS